MTDYSFYILTLQFLCKSYAVFNIALYARKLLLMCIALMKPSSNGPSWNPCSVQGSFQMPQHSSNCANEVDESWSNRFMSLVVSALRVYYQVLRWVLDSYQCTNASLAITSRIIISIVFRKNTLSDLLRKWSFSLKVVLFFNKIKIKNKVRRLGIK